MANVREMHKSERHIIQTYAVIVSSNDDSAALLLS